LSEALTGAKAVTISVARRDLKLVATFLAGEGDRHCVEGSAYACEAEEVAEKQRDESKRMPVEKPPHNDEESEACQTNETDDAFNHTPKYKS
jgi:hypothetical protein